MTHMNDTVKWLRKCEGFQIDSSGTIEFLTPVLQILDQCRCLLHNISYHKAFCLMKETILKNCVQNVKNVASCCANDGTGPY